ncbi:MAG: DMT family transporter [Planctomycetes bacterium]|nr:DMT family transporter [Planctomycetota bacterium]
MASLPESTTINRSGSPTSRGRAAFVTTVILATLVVIGGITPAAARIAMREMPIFTTGLLRFGVATLLLHLTAGLWVGNDPRRRVPIDRQDYLRLLICGLFCVPLNQAFFLGGVKLANAAHSGLFYALNPVLVYAITRACGLVRGSLRMALAAGLAFGGAAVIFLDGFHAAADGSFLLGDALLFLAVLTWAGYSVMIGPLGAKYGAVRTLTLIMTIGTLLYLPAALLDGSQLHISSLSWRAIAGFAFIAVLTSYLNYVLWFIALMRLNVNRLAVVMNAAPLFSVVAAYWLCGDPITPWLLAGAAVILIAITLANWDRLRMLRIRT